MASMGIIHSPLPKPSNPSFLSAKNPRSAFSRSSIAIKTDKSQGHALRALSSADHHLATPDPPSPAESTSAKKIDSWMEKSVAEIVRSLKKAPLLVQIYSEGDGSLKIRAEEAVPDEWALLQSNWRSGDVKSPDGLIFVEELDEDRDNNCVGEADEGVVTRAWGICVQGRGGSEAGPACYLLKTDRVCGGIGLGFCTHFCLMRVTTFRNTAFEQFKDAWLLR